MLTNPLSRLGGVAHEFSDLLVVLISLSAASLRTFPSIFNPNKRSIFWELFGRNLRHIGISSIPFVAVIAAVLSIFVFARALDYVSSIANYSDYYAQLFIIVVLRELGPLICGILLIARSGVAITAEMGFLKLNNEFEHLYAIGVDPKRLFLLPVFFAFPISLLILHVIFFTSCLLVSQLAMVLYSDVPLISGDFILFVLSKMNATEILITASKAIFGGVIIGLTALHFGCAVGGRFTDISRALQRSTTYSVMLYLLINVAFSAMGYLR